MAGNEKDKRQALAKYRYLLTRDKTPPPEPVPTSAAVISKEPVHYDAQPKPAPKPKDASLNFVPRNVSRPNQNKPPKQVSSKAKMDAMAAASSKQDTSKRLTYDEWMEKGVTKPNDDGYLFDNRPVNSYRGGYHHRNIPAKKKKKAEEENAPRDWNAIYDISKPLSYSEYEGSEVQFSVRHRWRKHLESFLPENKAKREAAEKAAAAEQGQSNLTAEKTFNVPAGYFNSNASSAPSRPTQPPPSAPADATGEDAFARRMAMSRGVQPAQGSVAPTQPQIAASAPAHSSPEPTASSPPSATQASPEVSSQSSMKGPANMSAPPGPQTLTQAPGAKKVIFAAPVMYGPVHSPNQPSQASDQAEAVNSASGYSMNVTMPQQDDSEQVPRSKRVNRKDWSKKLLMKTGWSEGSGLGSKGQGIVEPLELQINKRRKRNEEEGGGFVGSSTIGKITGGSYSKEAEAAAAEEFAKGPGELSRVILLEGLTRGLDLEKEMESGNLINKVGQECGKNGLVERIQVDWQSEDPAGAPIFVQFNNEMAALKALQDLKGRDFNGVKIDAKFYDAAKFDAGILS